MDLSQGYWQMPLDEESRKLTAFITASGMYRFRRVPFGLVNAPSAFQKAMTLEVLGSLSGKCAYAYLDDVIVWGASEDEFLTNLEAVFKAFRRAGLVIKPTKCQIGLSEILYCGHIISGDGVRMDKSRQDAVRAMSRPETVTQLRSFLGLTNYFRDFVPGYASMAGELYKFVQGNPKKHDKVRWSVPAIKSFDDIKEAVASTEKLYFLNDTDRILLYSDASNTAMGGVVVQVVDGVEKPILFISKSLTPTQRNYSVSDREMLAVYYCIKKAHHLLSGRRFTVFTDHRALVTLKDSFSPRIQRLKIALSEYDFDFEYIKGDQNTAADALSRLCVLTSDDKEAINKDRQAKILDFHSAKFGHLGVQATIQKMRDSGLDWPGLTTDVARVIAACPSCRRVKAAKTLHGFRFQLDAEKPWDEWAVDAMGPLEADRDGYKYILATVDACTRWVNLVPLYTLKAQECARELEKLFNTFGPPKRLRSDKGTQFLNSKVDKVLEKFRVTPEVGPAHNSQNNAMVERILREVRVQLGTILGEEYEQDQWSRAVSDVQRILNSRKHSRLGFSPADLVFGRFNALDMQWLVDRRNQEEVQDLLMEKLQENAEEKGEDSTTAESTATEPIAEEVEEDHPPTWLQAGQLVMVAIHDRKKSDPTNTNYIGPAVVLRQEGNRVKLMYEDSAKIDVVDIHHVKLCSDGELPKRKKRILFPKLYSHKAIEILGHQPRTNRKRPLSEISILVKYENFEEPQLVKLEESGLQDSELFKKYAEDFPQLQCHVISKGSDSFGINLI
jgi:transposase InsO family protein